MTDEPLNPKQVEARLGRIVNGPWNVRAPKATAYLEPPPAAYKLLATEVLPMASVSTLFGGTDKRRHRLLSDTLRAHWIGGDVIEPDQIQKRDALDEALTELQLMELSVEMGYLPLDAIRDRARERLLALLWSDAARGFVRDYDYLSVYYLANRVGIDIGQGAIESPPVKPDAAVRCAGILAEFTSWYEDSELQDWLSFLDDYIQIEGEQLVVWEYLTSGGDPQTADDSRSRKRVELLAQGARRFVQRLSTMMDLLDEDEQARAGLFLAYWMAKFFGWTLAANGFKKEGTNWAKVVETYLVASGTNPKMATQWQSAVRERMAVLEGAWDAVRELAKTFRKSRVGTVQHDVPAWIQLPGVDPADLGPLANDAVWAPISYPVGHAAAKDRRGEWCTVRIPEAARFANFIAVRAMQQGRIDVRVVNTSGSVNETRIVAPRGKELTAAMVLEKLDLHVG